MCRLICLSGTEGDIFRIDHIGVGDDANSYIQFRIHLDKLVDKCGVFLDSGQINIAFGVMLEHKPFFSIHDPIVFCFSQKAFGYRFECDPLITQYKLVIDIGFVFRRKLATFDPPTYVLPRFESMPPRLQY